MRIAITGATGFLGRYLVNHLRQAGHQLRCWYRLSSDRTGLPQAPGEVDWLPGNLKDRDAIRALIREAEGVVHAALEWNAGASFRGGEGENLDSFLRTNLLGSLQFFEEAHRAGVQRFVFISTCAVHEVIRDDRPLDEMHPLWPTSHYGAHKAALEKFVHSYGLGQGWPICALRPTGIYGLAHPARASRWYDLVGQVLRGEPIASARGGKEVHAHDVARAVALLLQVDPQVIAGQAFNCYDRYIAEEEVARIARDLSGSHSEIQSLNRGPKHQIETGKLRALGMTFGGEELLRKTVAELVEAHRGQEGGA
jgi:nucleoside-diphosphate-sugar epimerase